jgi:hypothetical protein
MRFAISTCIAALALLRVCHAYVPHGDTLPPYFFTLNDAPVNDLNEAPVNDVNEAPVKRSISAARLAIAYGAKVRRDVPQAQV